MFTRIQRKLLVKIHVGRNDAVLYDVQLPHDVIENFPSTLERQGVTVVCCLFVYFTVLSVEKKEKKKGAMCKT